MTTAPRIFVSIANYRDSETPHTIADLFARAAQPERISVGVLSQVAPGDDDCLAPTHPQVRQMCVHASQSRGACWARSIVLTELRCDEPYVLQIDSHSRFALDWDQRFIEMLALCPSLRPILSCYPVGYVPPDRLAQPVIPVHVPHAFNDRGVLTFKSHTIPYAQRPVVPIASAFVGAGCIFAPALAFDEVPYDPHLYFHGEEVTMSARLWTHGWDAFAPNDVLMYHDYTHDRGRPKHWEDHTDWGALNARSFARIRHLLAGEAVGDPQALVEIDRYGLGQKRALAEYESYAGVDFTRRWIKPPRAVSA